MATNSTLEVTLVPKVDKERLAKEIADALNIAQNFKKNEEIHDKVDEGTGLTTKVNKKKDSTENTESEKDKERKREFRILHTVVQTGFDFTEKTIKGIFGVVQDLFQKVKQSSQFLQTVESLFNLAVNLLLMPLGNAIAETILPATIELVDNVVGMWDTFSSFTGDRALNEIIKEVLNTGLEFIGDYIDDIGDTLKEQGGILGSIGTVLHAIGHFVADGALEFLLKQMFGIFKIIADYWPVFLGLFVSYKVAEIEIQLAMLVAQLKDSWVPGSGLIAGAAAVSLGLGAAAGISGAVIGNAEGGYIPATNGGTLVTVAEGGEGEYIIPESKMGKMGGGQNIVNNFYGYTRDELIQIVKETLRDEIQNSSYTGVAL